jgi:inorganic pyrophosphatase
VIAVSPVAMFAMRDEVGTDDKIICVPVRDPTWSHIERLDDLPRQLKPEVEHFFSVYKDLEEDEVEIGGWRPLEEARRTIEEARRRENTVGATAQA